jgi:cation diffusion facilitator CzcD-associated flavoprotein CzcO
MHVRVAIIGSGFGGLGTAIRLKQHGIDDFAVLERAADLGGTWRDNTYPGCACDVESHLYSFSFAPNPHWKWRFSRQPEIWEYLRACASRFGIVPHIRFACELRSAAWNDAARHWILDTASGPLTASIIVLSTGPLSEPVVPPLPGLARFEGRAFHSAGWDHAFDFRGRRVVVIGTGASAIQFVPEIQPQVAKLYLFQRTAPWVLPRPDGPIRDWQRAMYARLPLFQRAVRLGIHAYRELMLPLFRHPRMMRRAERVALRHMHAAIADPALRRKLTPPYTMGCKRILLSNDYYPALAQPNVEVVTNRIAEVRAHSIVSADGAERHVDAIVFGTGFRPTDPPLAPCIRGREGRTLRDAWAGTPKAYLGTTVSGFPNFFTLLGPNTGLAHTSVVYMTEAQIEHIVQALRHMDAQGAAAIEPTPEAQAAYVAEIDRRMQGTVWTSGGCASWYLDRTGRNAALWPDFATRYARRAVRFNPRHYSLDRLAPLATPAHAQAHAP